MKFTPIAIMVRHKPHSREPDAADVINGLGPCDPFFFMVAMSDFSYRLRMNK
ncbi:MAG: hypothetical protein HDS97_07670 [Bacteroidales bacterium]|nr:hypothetical protein [Bacteroidales bacterium]